MVVRNNIVIPQLHKNYGLSVLKVCNTYTSDGQNDLYHVTSTPDFATA